MIAVPEQLLDMQLLLTTPFRSKPCRQIPADTRNYTARNIMIQQYLYLVSVCAQKKQPAPNLTPAVMRSTEWFENSWSDRRKHRQSAETDTFCALFPKNNDFWITSGPSCTPVEP
ncbi:unnamed protein product [Ectocarpus sp. 13 AM-2016]